MAYTPQTWNNNDPSTPMNAARVNYMESGIQGAYGAPANLSGANSATRYAGATVSGAPATGTFAIGDFVVDQTGLFWTCTVAGSPGTWVASAPQSAVDAEAARASAAEAAITTSVGTAITPSTAGASLVVKGDLTGFQQTLLPFNAVGLESALPGTIPPAGSTYIATDTLVQFYSNGSTWTPYQWPDMNAYEVGSYTNIRRSGITTNFTTVSGTEQLVGVFIPKGTIINKIAFRVSATGVTFGSNNDGHWYVLISDSSGLLLANSSDQGTAVLNNNTTKDISLTGAWTAPSSNVYLFGVMIYAGTGGVPVQPSLAAATATQSSSVAGAGMVTNEKMYSQVRSSGITTGTPTGGTVGLGNSTNQPLMIPHT